MTTVRLRLSLIPGLWYCLAAWFHVSPSSVLHLYLCGVLVNSLSQFSNAINNVSVTGFHMPAMVLSVLCRHLDGNGCLLLIRPPAQKVRKFSFFIVLIYHIISPLSFSMLFINVYYYYYYYY